MDAHAVGRHGFVWRVEQLSKTPVLAMVVVDCQCNYGRGAAGLGIGLVAMAHKFTGFGWAKRVVRLAQIRASSAVVYLARLAIGFMDALALA